MGVHPLIGVHDPRLMLHVSKCKSILCLLRRQSSSCPPALAQGILAHGEQLGMEGRLLAPGSWPLEVTITSNPGSAAHPLW